MTTSKRFTQLLSNIALSDQQKINGQSAKESVVATLNGSYYGTSSKTQNSTYVGSWGKRTRLRPPRDVDVLYVLPSSVYNQYQARVGNKQSQLLQEVKGVLSSAYPHTVVRGSGPVVVASLSVFTVEIIPAFKLDTGQYYICMTEGGGSYKTAAYDAEASAMTTSESNSSGNTRHLIKMMKRWQAFCAVPIKSFWIELVAMDFLAQWEHRGKSTVYYDYMVRDFLIYLVAKAGLSVYAPGTYEAINLGTAWEAKAKTALAQAKSACGYEATSSIDAAGVEWQKLFGTDIPRNP